MELSFSVSISISLALSISVSSRGVGVCVFVAFVCAGLVLGEGMVLVRVSSHRTSTSQRHGVHGPRRCSQLIRAADGQRTSERHPRGRRDEVASGPGQEIVAEVAVVPG